jgi:glycosyltransferase involved in cell wall biosynthesis
MAQHTEPRRLKILISAYACRPNTGSEPGTGWNTILRLSCFHDLWVIASEEDRKSIETYISETPIPNVHWEFFDFTRVFWERRENELIRRVHYYLWQDRAYSLAKKLNEEVGFDVALHITLGTYWRPSFLSRLPIPFVWGPVGGAENAPVRWYPRLDFRTIAWELPKVIMEKASITFDPFVRRTARRASVALVPTERTYKQVKKLGATNIQYVPQVRLPQDDISLLKNLPRRQPSDTLRFISSGRLIGWKGIQFAVLAFAKVASEMPNVEYYHVGDGALADQLRAKAKELGISDRFKIIEGKTRHENLEMMANSDIFLFPNLHNEPGWVVLEAMALGLPSVFLLGMPQTPNGHKIGFKATSNNLNQAIDEMAEAMLKLAKDPELRQQMGNIARAEVDQYLCFEKTIDELSTLLEDAAASR